MTTRVVYLIHFDKPYKHAKHYLGSANDLDSRLVEHARASGSRLMAVIVEAGISWQLARTWRGGRKLERSLKSMKSAPRLCPICTPGTNAGGSISAKGGHRAPF